MTDLDDFFEQRIDGARDVHIVELVDDPSLVYEAVAFRAAGIDFVFLPTLDERGIDVELHVFVDGERPEGSKVPAAHLMMRRD